MNGVALAAVLGNVVVDLAAIGTAWHLIRSGRVRLSSPSIAQLQAEGQPQVPAEQAAPVETLRSAS